MTNFRRRSQARAIAVAPPRTIPVAPVAWVVAALLALAVFLPSLQADEVEFDNRVTVGETELIKQGEGNFRYRVFFKVYRAAFYLPAGAPDNAALGDSAKRLDIHYFYDISAADLVRAGDRILERNTTVSERESIAEGIRLINEFYQDVTPGDRYSLIFEPGRGTTLALNGEPLGTVPGDAFGRIYYRIWLGADPVDGDLRDSLLGE